MVEINSIMVERLHETTTMNAANQNKSGVEGALNDSWLDIVRRHVGSLDFGVVQIVVHGSRVVQIEKTEKVRLPHPIAVSPEQI